MDILSDILQTLKLRGTVYFHASFHAPWGMKIPKGEFANFHIVTDGDCWMKLAQDKQPIRVGQGDVLIFPRGDNHILCDDPRVEAVNATDLLNSPRQAEDAKGIAFGGEGAKTSSLICGHFEYDRECPHPLFESLDACIHIKASEEVDTRWITQASQLAASLTGNDQPGNDAVVDRLAEALFIQALVAHVNTMNDADSFLVAVQDQNIGQALKLMHGDIAHDWTLSELANACYMSRSVFAERFKKLVGEPPMVYLARWRMLKAREMLTNTQLTICDISEAVGYQSEFAFSKAFKKIVGDTPGALRRESARSI